MFEDSCCKGSSLEVIFSTKRKENLHAPKQITKFQEIEKHANCVFKIGAGKETSRPQSLSVLCLARLHPLARAQQTLFCLVTQSFLPNDWLSRNFHVNPGCSFLTIGKVWAHRFCRRSLGRKNCVTMRGSAREVNQNPRPSFPVRFATSENPPRVGGWGGRVLPYMNFKNCKSRERRSCLLVRWISQEI